MEWETPSFTELPAADVKRLKARFARQDRVASRPAEMQARQREANARYYSYNKEELNEASKRRYRNLSPAERLARHARYQMNRLSEVCSIVAADLVVGTNCKCCGQPFGEPAPIDATSDYPTRGNGLRARPPRPGNLPSLDRLDSSKGYVKGNVAVICWDCNRRKRDSTIEQLENIVAYMKREKGE